MSVPIITYHSLGDAPSPLWTPVKVFESHLKAFAESGFRTVALTDLLGCMQRGDPLPEDALVITFDDGYESVYREAWPRLRAWNFRATLFLISDFCGLDNRWPTQRASTPVAPLLTWEQVARLASEGCELGAHTCSHPPLTTLSQQRAEEEIVFSGNRIRERTGQNVGIFAYPYGDTDPSITRLVSRYYAGAASVRLGLVHRDSDCYALPRIDAHYLTPEWITRLRGPMFRNYLRLRQSLRSARRLLQCDWE